MYMSSLPHSNVRIALVAIGVVGAVFAPPYVPLVVMGILALCYRAPEVLAIGVLVDFLWLPVGDLFVALPLFTIAALVLVWGLEPLRSEFLMWGR